MNANIGRVAIDGKLRGWALALAAAVALATPLASRAAVTTYRWDPDSGTTVAGLTTNSSTCGDTTASSTRVTLMSTAGFCGDGRIETTQAGPFDALVMMRAAYATATRVTGQATGNRWALRNDGGSGAVTVRISLGYVLGGAFTAFGSVDIANVSTGGALYQPNLSGITGTAPAGSALALKVTVLVNRAGNNVRIYFRDRRNGGDSSGQIAVDESPLPTTTVANGTNPANATVQPGSGLVDLDGFTVATNTGTDTVTSLTVGLSANAWQYLSRVEVVNASNTVLAGVDNPTSDSVYLALPVANRIAATTTAQSFKIRIAPKGHTAMPPPPGGSYPITGVITGLESSPTYYKGSTDTSSATVTIDNQSPNAPTNFTSTAQASTPSVSLSWTNPPSFSQTVVLRNTSPVTDVPLEGTTSYAVGNTVGSSKVACVSGTSTTTCTDTTAPMVAGGTYYYAIFARDSNGNYSVAATTGPWKAAGTTVVGDNIPGTWNTPGNPDPSNTTIGPGGTAADLDTFTIDTASGTDDVDSVTVTLAAGTFEAIGTVEVRNWGGTLLGSIGNISSDVVTIPLTTHINATSTATAYRIRITSEAHDRVPLPEGSTYAITGRVTAIGGINNKQYSDNSSATVYVDNTSPGDVTNFQVDAAQTSTSQIRMTWSNPATDYAQTIILENTTQTNDVPVEGATYTVGQKIGTSTVVYVGNGTSFPDTTVTANTAYYYKAFAKDSFGNYSTPGTNGGPWKATNTTTVGNGTNNPGAQTLGPGAALTYVNQFTLQTNTGTDAISQVKVSLPTNGGAENAVEQIAITNDGNTQTYGSVTNPTSNIVWIPVSSLTADTTLRYYRVYLKPRAHAAMPAAPDRDYSFTPSVTGLNSNANKVYNDAASTWTIDNSGPSGLSLGTVTPSAGLTTAQIVVSWTNPSSTDFSMASGAETLLVRSAAPLSAGPVEGQYYAVGNSLGGGTVVYLNDSGHTSTTFTDTGLTKGAYYYYTLFSVDRYGNWTAPLQSGPWRAANITTVGNGASEAASVTLAPRLAAATGMTDLDAFSLQTNTSTDTVTAVTVDLAPGSVLGLDRVEVVCGGTPVLQGSVDNPSTDALTIPMNAANIALTTAAVQCKVRVRPKTHDQMPVPPGGTYVVAGNVSSVTSGNQVIDNDTSSSTITIDNESPGRPALAGVVSGDASVTVSWTNPADSDVGSVIVLRSTSPIAAVPAEGATYAAGNAIGASTVAFAAAAVAGADASQIISGLVNDTTYYFAVFVRDGNGNWSVASDEGSATPVAFRVSPLTASGRAVGCTAVDVLAPFASDGNNDSTITVSRGTAAAGPFSTSVCTNDGGTDNPRMCSDSVPDGATYYYQVTFTDPNGVAAPVTQVVGPIAVPACSAIISLSDPGTQFTAPYDLPIGGAPVPVGRFQVQVNKSTAMLMDFAVSNVGAAPLVTGDDVASLVIVEESATNPVLGVAQYDVSSGKWVARGLGYPVVFGAPKVLRLVATATGGATAGRNFKMQISSSDMTAADWAGVAKGTVLTGNQYVTKARTFTDGSTTKDTKAPMVSIVNPADGGVVGGAFKVQVHVYTASGVRGAALSSINYSTNGAAPDCSGTAKTLLDTGNKYFPSASYPNEAIYEVTLTPGQNLAGQGVYTLRVCARNASGTVVSRPVTVAVKAAGKGDGNLLVRDNSSQLCTDCHAVKTHSSQTSANLKTGTSQYGTWATTCVDCHTPHGTGNVYLFKETITPPTVDPANPQTPKRVQFYKGTEGDLGGPGGFVTSQNVAPNAVGPCQACHTRTKNRAGDPRWRNTSNVDTHYKAGNTQACTDCHSHVNGFSGFESQGGGNCASCHAGTWKRMTDAAGFQKYSRHLVGNVTGTNDSFNDTSAAWNGAQLASNAAAQRSCVNMCHQDHVHNPPGTVDKQHAYSVHKDATTQATRAVTRDAATGLIASLPAGAAGPATTDFDASATNGGMCVSCHQKPIDATRTTVIDKATYAASAHNATSDTGGGVTYRWEYVMHDSDPANPSVFARNCTKCHADPADQVSDGSAPFGAVHYSDYVSLLSGSTHPAGSEGRDPKTGAAIPNTTDTFLCLKCHGNGTDGTNATDKDVATPAGQTYYHPVKTDAVHDTRAEAKAAFNDGSFRGAKRHANCRDCHDPHAAGAARRALPASNVPNTWNRIPAASALTGAMGIQYGSNASGKTYPAAWGVPTAANFGATPVKATFEYEVCFKCHTSFAFGGTPPVPNGVGNSGTQQTDLAQEFNPNNRAAHPVVVALNDMTGSVAPKALATSQLVAPWNSVANPTARTGVGYQTMTCTDCHNYVGSGSAAQGPHGSAVKFMLKGTNGQVYWPRNSSGQLFSLGGGGGGWGGGWGGGGGSGGTSELFCMNCHPDPGNTNGVHREGDHSGYECVRCHIIIPHGGKVSRLIATPNAPARYKDATRAPNVLSFVKRSGNYDEGDCATNCGEHNSSAITGQEKW